MSIGTIIESRRKELNLTLEAIGNFVGVGKSTVKKWENGHIENMKRDKIALLAEILQVSPITFITGELLPRDINENATFSQAPKMLQTDTTKKQLLDLFNQLNPDDKLKFISELNQTLSTESCQ